MKQSKKLTSGRIIEAARASVETYGHERLTLRALAGELSVTAPALYDHFSSRDAVLRAVAEEGYRELANASGVEGSRAIDRVRARALAYVGFALDHPELFRLMFLFRPDAVAIEADNELGAASDAFSVGTADVAIAITDGDLEDRDPIELGLILWTAMHGVATVSLLAAPVAEVVAADVIDALLVGLRPAVGR